MVFDGGDNVVRKRPLDYRSTRASFDTTSPDRRRSYRDGYPREGYVKGKTDPFAEPTQVTDYQTVPDATISDVSSNWETVPPSSYPQGSLVPPPRECSIPDEITDTLDEILEVVTTPEEEPPVSLDEPPEGSTTTIFYTLGGSVDYIIKTDPQAPSRSWKKTLTYNLDGSIATVSNWVKQF